MDNAQSWLLGRLSLPFPGDDPDRFMAALRPWRGYVHSVFTGLDQRFPQTHPYPVGMHGHVEDFVVRYAGTVPVFITLNLTLPPKLRTADYVDHLLTRDDVLKFMHSTGVAGVIVAEPLVARAVHEALPNLVIHASVDSFDDPFGEAWANIPLAAVNAPHDAAVDLPWLRRLRMHGVPVKVMVNLACRRHCPWTRTHLQLDAREALGLITTEQAAERARRLTRVTIDDYRAHVWSTLVLPRWLPRYAGLADIVKIDGKGMGTPWLMDTVDTYVHARDDVLLGQLTVGAPCCWSSVICDESVRDLSMFPTKLLPDDLLTVDDEVDEAVVEAVWRRVRLYHRAVNGEGLT